MKTTIPERIVELCDICEREGYLSKCKACGKMYCLTCDALIPGCVHKIDVCLKCGDDEKVNAIAKKYAPLISSILTKRDKELSGLSRGCGELRATTNKGDK